MDITIIHNNPVPPIRKTLKGGELFAYKRYPETVWIAGFLETSHEIKDINPSNGVIVKVYEDEINLEVLVYARIQIPV